MRPNKRNGEGREREISTPINEETHRSDYTSIHQQIMIMIPVCASEYRQRTNERTSKRESPFFPFAETHALIAAILSAIQQTIYMRPEQREREKKMLKEEKKKLIELVDAIHMWMLNLQRYMSIKKNAERERGRERMTNALDR